MYNNIYDYNSELDLEGSNSFISGVSEVYLNKLQK